MGAICSGDINPNSPNFSYFNQNSPTLLSKDDLQISPDIFVQENLDSFYETYNLHATPIGSGAFAEVWLCDHKRTNETRAVKILHKTTIKAEDIRIRSVFLEVEIIKKLDHPNILKVFEYFESDLDYFIVMEYCPGGDLFDKIESVGRFTEKYAAKVMKLLLSGLNYLHCRGVVHRDIKPENVLMIDPDNEEELSIKIIDFNVATKKLDKMLNGVTGTTDYMAPEVFKGKYNEKCDLWSSGVILYMMMSGCLPFPCSTEEEAEKNICNGNISFPDEIFGNVSEGCKDLICQLLCKDQEKRPSASEVLSHCWLVSNAPDKCDKETMSRTVKRMKSSLKCGKLSQLFTTFLISQVDYSVGLSKLAQVFATFDKNKDGVINFEELVEQLSLEMTREEAIEEAEKIMTKMDCNGSGEVEYSEFLRVALEEKDLLTRENLRKAFCYFDKDKNGSIDKLEIVEWLSTGNIIPERVVQDLIEEADKNGDGFIDIDEFQELLVSKLELE